MIRKNGDFKTEIRENMRGGDGNVKITHFVSSDELYDKGRLFGTITLEKNCSIGYHTHESDSEIFVVMQGTAEYNDNGTIVQTEKGDVLICAKGEGHSIRNNSDESLVLTALIVYA